MTDERDSRDGARQVTPTQRDDEFDDEFGGMRALWTEAIRANRRLIANRDKGEARFEKLLRKHPSDGMVFYTRGEAYEHIGELALARLDYERAINSFPMKRWRRIAREALERVAGKVDGTYSESESTATYFHRMHGIPEIPHDIRVDALSAIPKLDSEPHLSTFVTPSGRSNDS